jgi:large subunit ribosomal protein L10
LKAAYVQESVYVGADQLEALIAVKSKNELIADVVAMLKSPMNTVLSQLQSGGNIIHGVLDTLKEKK